MKAARLSEDHELLARATCVNTKYEDMKKTIIRIFGDFSYCDQPSVSAHPGITGDMSTMMIKSEPTFPLENPNDNDVLYSNSGRNQGGYYKPGYQGGRGKGRGNSSYNKQYNNDYVCYKCGKPNHFRKDCPQLKRNKKNVQTVHITLFNSDKNADQSKVMGLVKDALGHAVLDSACIKTVTGELWLEEQISNLSSEDQKKVRYEQDDTAFRFGDGNVCVSKKLVYFPAVLGGRRVTIRSSVVPNCIPLLLSKDSMAKAGFILDFGGGRVKIQNNWCKLKTSASRHFLIPLDMRVKMLFCMQKI